MPKGLRGTGVALVTPFHKDGSIDFKCLGNLVDRMIDNGVDYLVVLGTTGESVTLSSDEKMAVLGLVVDQAEGRVPIVLGLGGNNTNEIINDIQYYDFDGVEAILSVSPYYNKPTQKGLYQHYKMITNLSPVPVILYNVPGRTGSNISAETTLRLAYDFEGIIGVKEASGDLEQCMDIIKNKPEGFLVISGDDALTLPLIAIGGDGVISVVVNAFPKDFSQLVSNALRGNMKLAREYHYKLFEIIENLFVEGNPAGVKAAMEIMNNCEANLGLPLTQVSRTTYNKLSGLIEAANKGRPAEKVS
ncbi:MAG: 4-hydroxy-tetrahydrodipicolinate synthase [Flavobacteriales bacterium]|nr:4-hydroxy-tetrahydrodipicolinate synthase [Flavobacteriales bacterium]